MKHSTWTYHEKSRMLETKDNEHFRHPQYIVRELTDSTLVLSALDVLPADEILAYADFERVQNVIRQYGERKTINNQWNQQPGFRFPFADVYLMPYGENTKVFLEPLPYYFYGLTAHLPNGQEVHIEYIDRAYVYIASGDTEVLRTLVKQLAGFCEQYPLPEFADGKLMHNEGFYPFLPDSTDEGVHVRVISKETYETGAATCIPLSTDSMLTEVSLLMTSLIPLPATRKDRLTHIHLTTMHSRSFDGKTDMQYGNTDFFYTFHVEIAGVEKRFPIGFFGSRGVVEEIKDGVLLKVRHVPPFGAAAFPVAHFYYRMEYGSK